MTEVIANLIKGDSIGVETDYRDALPINMTAVVKQMFGANGYMLQHPGLTKYSEGIGIDRGGLWNERHGEHYRVSSGTLIKVDAAGAITALGTVPGLDTASLPYSFNTQGIVADGRFFLYDPANGLVENTDPNLGNPVDATWINGRYFFTDLENIYHTNITDETQIDTLKFATSEFSPDPTLGVGKTFDNKAIAFNRYSTEFFKDIASANFSFTRQENRAIKAGIVGTHCKVEIGNDWYIMGGRKAENVSIHVLNGANIVNVSTREVDKTIAKYTEEQLSISVLEARTVDNYAYLIVHLPAEVLIFNKTIAKAAGKEAAWSILSTGIEKPVQWRGKFGVFEPRLGKWVYGDKRNSNLGILDDTAATQYDELSEWQLNTPFMYFNALSIDEIEVETIPGHSTDDDATVFISLTYDGMTHGFEYRKVYGEPSGFAKRFISYQYGHIDAWVSIKMRGASRSRMAFSRAKLQVG